MDVEGFLRAVAVVPWGELHGAYGPSDGTAEYGASDVADALQVLARELDVDGDAWCDAMDVVLGHVWHQGTIYPVTVHAWPLVLRLADELPVPRRSEVARALALLVLAAVHGLDDPETAPIGQRVLDLVRRHAHVILAWVHDERHEATAAVVLAMPELLPRWVEVAERADLGAAEFLVLASLSRLPPWASTCARQAILSTDEPTAIAAAILVAREEPPSRAIAERLDEVLRPGAEARLRKAFALPVPVPELPRGPFAGFAGETLEATALFVGAKVVTLRVGGSRNLTLRWVPDGLRKGDVVHVGMTTSARPCWIEWTDATGRRERVELTAELTRGP